MLQAVKNPFVEEVEIVLEESDDEEAVPEPEIINSIVQEETAALTLDDDDPFEPEAEVDIGEADDFLPSINPLSSFPSETHFVHQSLELLPASYLETIRQQREFEDSIADLREFDEEDLEDHRQRKREKVIGPESREVFLSDAAYNKDKIHAYNIYRSQWTSSGDKKLVVDASKELEKYYKEQRLVSAPSFSVDIDNQLYGETDRDTAQPSQVITNISRAKTILHNIQQKYFSLLKFRRNYL